jgi:hypothetical protein
MARDILKSNNSIVIAGQRPAFTTGHRVDSDMSGAYMSAVQSVSVGFSQQRQKSKQIGSKDLAINDITRMPDVDLSISYYYTPAMFNENMLGLIDANPSYDGTGFFKDYTNEDQNFYIINHQNQGSDIINNGDSEVGNLTKDSEVISIGNAFLTNYSLGFSVGSVPIVSTSYKCSNIKMENGFFDESDNPAINLQLGNNTNAGVVQLENAKVSGFDYYSSLNRFNPPLCSPTDVNVTLQNLQIGGAPISGDAHLQSFSFNIPINRVDLFGLGSDYPYGRKIQYPITSSVSLEFLVSGFATGEIASLITNESGYDFDIQVMDTGEEYQNTFSFENLRLESSSYQMQVNGQMTYSLGFSFEITN